MVYVEDCSLVATTNELRLSHLCSVFIKIFVDCEYDIHVMNDAFNYYMSAFCLLWKFLNLVLVFQLIYNLK